MEAGEKRKRQHTTTNDVAVVKDWPLDVRKWVRVRVSVRVRGLPRLKFTSCGDMLDL